MKTRPAAVAVLFALLLGGMGSWGLLHSERARLQAEFDREAAAAQRQISLRLVEAQGALLTLDASRQAGTDPQALEQAARRILPELPQLREVELCSPECGPVSERPGQLALTQGGVRLWLDPARLLSPAEWPRLPTELSLRGPQGALWTRQPALSRGPLMLEAAREVSAAPPLRLELRHRPGWAAWPWGGLAAWWAVVVAMAALLGGLLSRGARIDRELRRERLRAQGILQATPDGIVALDPQGRITLANPAAARIFGPLSPGRDMAMLAPLHGSLAHAPLDAAALWQSEEAVELPEGTVLQREGASLLVEGSLVPLRGEDGELMGRALTVREAGPLQRRMVQRLSEHEQRQQEHEALLSHVTRLATLGEMSAGMAHELNQPLTAIVSYGQAAARLLDEARPSDADGALARARQAVAASVEQAQRAAAIIVRLRGLVRRAPPEPAAVSLETAVQNVLSLCAPDLRRLGVRLHTRLGGAHVWADPVQVEQIVLNLVRNATDALTEQPGPRYLQLSAAQRGKDCVLWVRDSGPGLDADALATLFQPFHTAKIGGLGLGLSLSQTLAQGMGGELTGGNVPADSARGWPAGAEFTLTLPALEET